MKRKAKPKKDNSERWMLTYLDFITLMFAFFVIMYASSSISANKFKQISESFKVAFGGGKTIVGNDQAVSQNESPKYIDTKQKEKAAQAAAAAAAKAQTASEAQKQNTLNEVKEKIDNYLKDNNMAGSVSTNLQERGLVIRIQDALFFDSASADVKPQWSQKLIEISKILNTIDNYIRIEGHTDNVPISDSNFSDNLDLSCGRAANVYRLLQTKGGISKDRLSAEGYGDSRPVADNNTEAGKAQNRRVDIVIINSKYNATENAK